MFIKFKGMKYIKKSFQYLIHNVFCCLYMLGKYPTNNYFRCGGSIVLVSNCLTINFITLIAFIAFYIKKYFEFNIIDYISKIYFFIPFVVFPIFSIFFLTYKHFDKNNYYLDILDKFHNDNLKRKIISYITVFIYIYISFKLLFYFGLKAPLNTI